MRFPGESYEAVRGERTASMKKKPNVKKNPPFFFFFFNGAKQDSALQFVKI